MKYEVTLMDGRKFIQETEILYTQDEEKFVVMSMIAISEESNDEDMTVEVEDGDSIIEKIGFYMDIIKLFMMTSAILIVISFCVLVVTENV
jgi:hypothetical protein